MSIVEPSETKDKTSTGQPAIAIREFTVLAGPNIWSNRPVVHLRVDSGATTELENARLRQLLSDVVLVPAAEEAPDAGEAPLNIGQVFAGLIFEMQVFAGEAIAFSTSLPAAAYGQFDVVTEYREEAVARAVAGLALRLLNHLLIQSEPRFDFEKELDRRVTELIRRRSRRPHLDAVIRAAERRGIPIRYAHGSESIIELGTGAFMRRYWGMNTSQTPVIGARVSSSKPLTTHLLRERGLPVAEGFVTRTVEEALAAAERIGYPVVVKPTDRSQGVGVGVDIRTPTHLRKLFAIAKEASLAGAVLVERFVAGSDHRIMVINDKVEAVALRRPAHVIGDGVHTIRELIEITNADPLRGPGHVNVLTYISVDAATRDALQRQDLTLDSIPEPGQHVQVKLMANMSQGATAADLTDVIHPENARLARLVARVLELDICGVDLITPDISRPVWEVGGAFIEANFGPGFNPHLVPQEGVSHDLGRAVVDMLFPPGRLWQPSIVAITGSQGVVAACRIAERMMRAAGKTVGVSTRRGTTIDGVPMPLRHQPGRANPELVLLDPYVDGAVFEVQSRDAEERGMAYRRCDVTVVTRSGDDEPRGLRTVEAVLLEMAGPDGAAVIDAADPRFDALAAAAPASRVLFSQDAENPRIGEHLNGGGRAVVAAGQTMKLLADGEDRAIIELGDIAGVAGSAIGELLVGALAAAAAGAALDVPAATIRQVLASSSDG